jgi:hypothetical protein
MTKRLKEARRLRNAALGSQSQTESTWLNHVPT